MSEVVYLNEKGTVGGRFIHGVGTVLVSHDFVWNPDDERVEAYCSCEDIIYVAPEEGIREDTLVT